MRVHVLTEYRSPNSLALNYPLLIHRSFFRKQGFDIYFHDNIGKKIYGCEVLFINSKFFREWHAKKVDKLYDILGSFKKSIDRVIWFDTNDSTGTTQFNVMPLVDAYYKSQVLKDRYLYMKPFYGYRIFTDFYRNRFGISDEEGPAGNIAQTSSVSVLLQKEHAHKLRVSWNSAMNEWGRHNYIYGGLVNKIRSYLKFKTDYTVRFVRPDKERQADINARIGLSHSRKTVRFQRQMIANILKDRFNVAANKVPRPKYIEELSNSKIGISPFGWGEISCRDFDIIINGALLFKQDMSHLETWPPLYVKDETYVAYSWGLEDFEEKLRELLGKREKIAAVSKKAQDLYAYYLYGNGRTEFCEKVLDIVR